MPTKVGNKEAFLAAFRVTGDISQSTKVAGVQRGIHYRWIHDPEYKAAFMKAAAGFAAKQAARAHKEVSSTVEGELRAEISRLNKRVTEMGKRLNLKIRELAAKRVEVARVRRAPADEGTELLDQIAKGMAKKPFARLSPEHQDTVRDIAARMKTSPD